MLSEKQRAFLLYSLSRERAFTISIPYHFRYLIVICIVQRNLTRITITDKSSISRYAVECAITMANTTAQLKQ